MYPTNDLFASHVNVLHISDLHIGASAPQDERDRMQVVAEAVTRVARALEAVGGFHALVVSGDVVDKGYGNTKNTKNYERALGLLTSLRAACGGLSARRVVVCPGNHDICGPEPRPFKDYIDFINALRPFAPPIVRGCPSWRLLQSTHIPMGLGVSAVFCSMNSRDPQEAQPAYREKGALSPFNDKEKPIYADTEPRISSVQVDSATKLFEQEAPRENTVRIAVMHHGLPAPPNVVPASFETDDARVTRYRLSSKIRVGFLLAGHVHVGTDESDAAPVISAGKLFGRSVKPADEPFRPQFSLLRVFGFPYETGNGLVWAMHHYSFALSDDGRRFALLPSARFRLCPQHADDVRFLDLLEKTLCEDSNELSAGLE